MFVFVQIHSSEQPDLCIKVFKTLKKVSCLRLRPCKSKDKNGIECQILGVTNDGKLNHFSYGRCNESDDPIESYKWDGCHSYCLVQVDARMESSIPFFSYTSRSMAPSIANNGAIDGAIDGLEGFYSIILTR